MNRLQRTGLRVALAIVLYAGLQLLAGCSGPSADERSQNTRLCAPYQGRRVVVDGAYGWAHGATYKGWLHFYPEAMTGGKTPFNFRVHCSQFGLAQPSLERPQ